MFQSILNRERNTGKGPPAKRRKVTKGEASEIDREDTIEDGKRIEKRKGTEDAGPENIKRRKTTHDIRDMMRPKAKTMLEEKQEEIEEIVEEHPIYYGEAETVEFVD